MFFKNSWNIIVCAHSFSCVWLFETPWTIGCQASLSKEFSSQEHWSGSIPRFLRNFHTVLHSGCTSLHSHQQCKSVSFFSTPSPDIVVCRLFLWWPFWPAETILHCVFNLHFSSNEWCCDMRKLHIFFYVLLALCISSLEKCLFNSLAHFLIGLFIFLVLSCMNCLYILELNSLSVVSFAVIVFHSEGCFSTGLIVSFVVQKLLSLPRSHLYFCFISITLQGGS